MRSSLWILCLMTITKVSAKCPPPPAVINTTVTLVENSDLETALYTCDASKGFRTKGNNTIICLEPLGYSLWSPVMFVCERVKCTQFPVIPANATFSWFDRNFYGKVYYPRRSTRCRYRYSNGGCGDYSYRYYGIDKIDIFYNGHITMNCSSGFSLSNRSTTIDVYCGIDGNWIYPDIKCLRICAADPPSVAHSEHKVFGTLAGSLTKYTCDFGYQADFNITCLSTGRWSSTSICKLKDCGQPPHVAHGRITRTLTGKTTFGATVSYLCAELGYKLHGPSTILCTGDGTWTAKPLCLKKNCGEPPTVEHSRKIWVAGHYYGDNVTYLCDRGHSLINNGTISCQLDGYWTTPPTCRVSSCGAPPDLINAEYSTLSENYTVREELSFKCPEGYLSDGPLKITCLSSAEWSEPRECRRVHCGEPYIVTNSKRNVRGHYYNDSTTYDCSLGYTLAGSKVSFCQKDGHWSVPPECHIVSCGVPPAVNHASVSEISGFSLGQKISYQCMTGYRIVGVDFVTCLVNGQWSYAPLCYRDGTHDGDPAQHLIWTTLTPVITVSCGVPPHVESSEVQMTGILQDDIAIYQCQLGFRRQGNSTAVCKHDGKWTQPPSREVQSCELPPKVEHSRTIGQDRFVSAKVVYECDEGYKSDAVDSSIECLPTVRWSAAPDCIEVYCGEPYQVLNSHSLTTGHYYNDTVRYSCHTGFTMRGEDSIRCQEDAHWSIPPECQEIVCHLPPSVNKARLREVTGYKLADTAEYMCTEGYELKGSGYIVCQLDGLWSEGPECIDGSEDLNVTTENLEYDYLTTTSSATPLHSKSQDLQHGIPQHATTPNTFKHSKEAFGFEELVSTRLKDESSTAQPLEIVEADYNGMSPSQKPFVISLIPITSVPSTSKSAATTEVSTLSKTVPTSHKTETPDHHTVLNKSSAEIPSALNGSSAARSDYLTDDTSESTTYNHSNVVIGCSVFAVISVLVLIALALYWKIGANRRRGEHNFIPVANALYQADGQTMTVYSFKEE